LFLSRSVKWGLPGWGSKGGPDCGVVTGFVRCRSLLGGGQQRFFSGKHVSRPMRSGCGRRDCPECYQVWAGRAAGRVEWRLKEVSRLYRKAGLKLGPCNHYALSPPPKMAAEAARTVEGYKELRREAFRLAEAVGIRGGCVLFHPYRTKDMALEPHFHVLGHGFLHSQHVRRLHKKSGWVFKNLGKRTGVHHTLQYLLSHTGVGKYEGARLVHGSKIRVLHSVDWFGLFSSRHVRIKRDSFGRPERLVSKEAEFCACGEMCCRLDVDEKELGVFYVKQSNPLFELSDFALAALPPPMKVKVRKQVDLSRFG